MSIEDNISEGIDDYLLAVADGVAEAQERLEEFALLHPNASSHYRIPKVDFELKLHIYLRQVDSAADRPVTRPGVNRATLPLLAVKPSKINHLKFKARAISAVPSSPGQKSSTMNETATSTIKGSIVAVPPNGGIPAPRLIAALIKGGNAREIKVEARLENTAGESLEGQVVEFNLNRLESQALNVENKILLPNKPEGHIPLPSTRFFRVQSTVNGEGIAESTLALSAKEPNGANFVIEVMAEGLLVQKIYTML